MRYCGTFTGVSFLCVLMQVILISGCRVAIISSEETRVAPDTPPMAIYLPALSIVRLPEAIGNLGFSVEVSESLVSIQGVPAGVAQDFGVFFDGAPAPSVSCRTEDGGLLWTEAHRIHFDPGLRKLAQSVLLDCSSSSRSFVVALGLAPSRVSVVSSAPTELLAGAGLTNSGHPSSDGKWHLFGARAPASPFQQVFLKSWEDGSVRVASVNAGGAELANESVEPGNATSDGRYVVLTTRANNLVPMAASSVTQIYRKDLLTGEVLLVSALDGTPETRGDGDSSNPHISDDGRYIAFLSYSANLVPGAGGGQIYRRDMKTGEIRLVSTNDGGLTGMAVDWCGSPQISSDGSMIVFKSGPGNFVPGVPADQIYLRNMNSTDLVLVSSRDGTSATAQNGDLSDPWMTPDGAFVAFISSGDTLVAGISGAQAYVKDITTGTLALASSTDGTQAGSIQGSEPGSSNVDDVSISSDGRYVAFSADNVALFGGVAGYQIYRKDLKDGGIEIVSSVDGTKARVISNESGRPKINGDGTWVVFKSFGPSTIDRFQFDMIYRKNMVSGEIQAIRFEGLSISQGFRWGGHATSVTPDARYVAITSTKGQWSGGISLDRTFIWRKDRLTGALLFVSAPGGTDPSDNCSRGTLSDDGSQLAFESAATNLVPGTSGQQVFVKDFKTGALTLASSTDGTAANQRGASYSMISGNGQYVVFRGDDLLIYRKDLQTGALEVVSSAVDGTPANSASDVPVISRNGEYVAFASSATNLGTSNTRSAGHAYRKNMVTHEVELASSLDGTEATEAEWGVSGTISMSADGRYIAFKSTTTNFLPGTSGWQAWRRDMQGGMVLVTSLDGTAANQDNTGGGDDPALSADGRYVMFHGVRSNLSPGATFDGRQLFRKDLVNGTIVPVCSSDGSWAGVANSECRYGLLTLDGNGVVFNADPSNLVAEVSGPNVYFVDLSP